MKKLIPVIVAALLTACHSEKKPTKEQIPLSLIGERLGSKDWLYTYFDTNGVYLRISNQVVIEIDTERFFRAFNEQRETYKRLGVLVPMSAFPLHPPPLSQPETSPDSTVL